MAQFSVNDAPASGTFAVATIAAGGATVRHRCRGFILTVDAPAIATSPEWALRDGASGAGTILLQGSMRLDAATNIRQQIIVSNVELIGSLDMAMTVEFTGVVTAGVFYVANIWGDSI